MARGMSRRRFVGGLTAGAAFTIVPRHVLGRGYLAPSDTVRVACIGVGGMGENDVKGLAALPDVRIHALCDVDRRMAEAAFGSHPAARRYADYRELLAREAREVDAVTVSTPDHSHAAATLLALRAGKHVYCQKPLTRTIHEARVVTREARARPQQATQMGNQGHANEGTRKLREMVEAGAIGAVRRVEFWTNRPWWPQGVDRPTELHAVPPTVDWNLWLGPAAERPYHPGYAPFKWRGWWDFGTGALGDMACHMMDAAYWTLQPRYPSRVTAEVSGIHPETGPEASRVEFEFPARGGRPAVTFVWRDGGLVPPRPADWPGEAMWPFDGNGQLWIGDRGTLVADTYGDGPRLSDPRMQAELEASPPAERYPRTDGVHAEWIAAIKAGTQPGSSFPGHAGPFTEMILLGNLAVRSGRSLEVDPETGVLRSGGIPDEWITPRYRSGWSL